MCLFILAPKDFAHAQLIIDYDICKPKQGLTCSVRCDVVTVFLRYYYNIKPLPPSAVTTDLSGPVLHYYNTTTLRGYTVTLSLSLSLSLSLTLSGGYSDI